MFHADILIEEYNYQLPVEKIAFYPLEKRDASRLLIFDKSGINEDKFSNLPNHLPGDALMIFNNTRVLEARLFFTKPTGGVIEVFCLEPHQLSMEQALSKKDTVEWKCLIGGASKWKPGQVLSKKILINGKTVVLQASYIGAAGDAFIIAFTWDGEQSSFAEIIQAAGAIPLPPYIKRRADSEDSERYQTLFAKIKGSVAAPTAALHFTDATFAHLRQKNILIDYVTLNVGAGTFQPVKTANIADHKMHGETFTVHRSTIENILSGRTIVAVGTTSLRTLESLHWIGVKISTGVVQTQWTIDQWEAYALDQEMPYTESLRHILHWMEKSATDIISCKTSLLIVPGYSFKMAAAIVTNFHQPKSTLLLLIAAFISKNWRDVYDYALQHQFRFLSYGDSSLLWRK